jgi:hypothetical protein
VSLLRIELNIARGHNRDCLTIAIHGRAPIAYTYELDAICDTEALLFTEQPGFKGSSNGDASTS